MPNRKNNHKNTSGTDQSKKDKNESWIDPDRVVNKAQNIVNSAVNVLEEEIAAGILAAKNIEKKLIDVDELRSNPDALMNRIRRDSHEVLDLVIDGFASITSQMNEVLEALKNETDSASKKNKSASKRSSKPSNANIIFLEPEHPLKPGETTTLSLSLFNDSVNETNTIELRKSDFLGSGSHKIGLRAIKIEPKSVQLKPQEEKDIKITLNLPKNSKVGHYNTFITDINNPKTRILLALEVVN